ncbi:MAG: nicotinate-nucleotide pyrophosphorylase (carboxylating) [Verrucomicrobiales bacterium]|jgi:nicotinate-nucleotide pyrophosphorylase (carboxylating)
MREEDPTQFLIEAALREDLDVDGDVTSQYFTPESAHGRGRIFAKEPASLSGVEIAARVFAAVDQLLLVEVEAEDGTKLEPGGTALRVEGSLRSILTAERTALNFIQRLSGVATLTAKFVGAIGDSKAKLLDTRKTTPGWRLLEKKAVGDGGGTNHRIGLFDHVMVKDNHLLAAPDQADLVESIRRVKADFPEKRVQLEADTLQQLLSFLKFDGVDSVLLDNMSLADLREAVRLRDERNPGLALEASGGITLETIGGVAQTGVDFISVGALTHSATAVDFSLELEAVNS